MSTSLRIEYLPIAGLAEATRNAKKHADAQLQESIGRFGHVEPIVIDERTQRLVAGHGRRNALVAMQAAGKSPPPGITVDDDGRWLAPVVRGWSSRDDTEAEAYLVASNRLTELGGWNDQVLAEMLGDLAKADALSGVGYSPAEVSALLDDAAADPRTDLDEYVEPKVIHVKPGELWQLGEHRIICGSSTEAADVDRVMDGALADMCWTDPPWNVALGAVETSKQRSSANERRKKKSGIQAIANDALGEDFPAFMDAAIRQMARVLKPGAPTYVAMSAQEWGTLMSGLTRGGFHWSSTIIWAKAQLVISRRDYHPQYEPIWYGWREGAGRLVALKDRTQSDVWNMAAPRKSEDHPTMKPVELVARSLRNSSLRDAIVYEPFSGSGTTLLACEETGRRCRAIELEPGYVQVAIDRWEALTGRKAVRL